MPWAEHTDNLLTEARLASPRMPLVAERQGSRLVIRVVSDAGQKMLLLERQVTAVEPGRFQALGLTGREAEVLAWVAQGKTNWEIASILGTSPRTVQKHLEHMFQKLGVETRTAAAVWAVSNGAAQKQAVTRSHPRRKQTLNAD